MTPDRPADQRIAYVLEEMERLGVSIIRRGVCGYIQALDGSSVYEEEYPLKVCVSPSDADGVED
jgi:hypothetical protein